MTKKRWIIRLVKCAVILTMIALWILYLSKSWEQLKNFDFNCDWKWISLSFLVTLAGYVMLGFLWAPLLREITGLTVDYWRSFQITSISLMGRYVPGKVWAIAGKSLLTTRNKRDIPKASLAALIETVMTQSSGLLLSVTILPFCGFASSTILRRDALYALAAIALLCVMCLHPSIFLRVSNFILRVARQPLIETRPRFSRMILIFTLQAIVFALWSLGFVFLSYSFIQLPFDQAVFLFAVFPAASVIGFLMLVAPGGLGVRESIITIVLNRAMPGQQANILVIVVMSRLLSTLVEMLCFVAAITTSRSNAGDSPWFSIKGKRRARESGKDEKRPLIS